MAILSVNAGSSTLKFALHPRTAGKVLPGVLIGSIQGLEVGGTPSLRWSFAGREHHQAMPAAEDSFAQALATLRDVLTGQAGLPAIEAVAHRVVHGGRDFRASLIVSDAILGQLEALNSLAPLHQSHNIAGIRAFRQAYPALPQVACFDTAFHATLPVLEHTFALPRVLADEGVRRYGFHGLSYQYIMGALQERTPRANARVLMAHLGNGASLCAAQGGQSRATTMGFSVLDGLMMGTRSGALDPGVLLYLLEQGWDHDRLQTLLYRQSGLLGVSGISADMRHLRADASAAAREAIDLFTHHVVRESGAMAACIGGLDLLAFSGGIGEHDTVLRGQVCERLAFLGVRIDAAANAAASGAAPCPVHAADSTVEVWVVPTDEGRVAAREAAALLAAPT